MQLFYIHGPVELGQLPFGLEVVLLEEGEEEGEGGEGGEEEKEEEGVGGEGEGCVV